MAIDNRLPGRGRRAGRRKGGIGRWSCEEGMFLDPLSGSGTVAALAVETQDDLGG